MRTIKTGRPIRGSASVKFVILLMLLAGLGIAVDYRMSIPGSSLVDRLRAKPVVLDVDSLSGENQLSIKQTKLSSVRVSFSAEDHPKMLSLMQKRFGPERRFGQRTDAFGNNIVGWVRPSGIVAINDSADGNEEPFLLWTSADTILKKVLGNAPGR